MLGKIVGVLCCINLLHIFGCGFHIFKIYKFRSQSIPTFFEYNLYLFNDIQLHFQTKNIFKALNG